MKPPQNRASTILSRRSALIAGPSAALLARRRPQTTPAVDEKPQEYDPDGSRRRFSRFKQDPTANRAEFGLLLDELTRRSQRLANTRNHCKLLCFALADGRKLTLHGSLNLRRCNAYEQAALSAD